MRSAFWSSSKPRSRIALLLALCLLCLSSLGATCENQDYYLPQRLSLNDAPPMTPKVVDISLPYRGLNSLDFRITNTGTQGSYYGLAVSACRVCRQDRDCGSQAEIDDEGIQCDPQRHFCRTESEPDPCLMPETAGPIWLEPGAYHNGRMNEGRLGLGDHLHVEFLCLPGQNQEATPCSGEVGLLILLRQVECRVDTQCDSNEICDSQTGFCRAEVAIDEGCYTLPGSRSQPLWPGLILLLWMVVALRNRGVSGVRWMRRVLLAILILLACLIPQFAHAGRPAGFRRTQVYIQPSFQMSHLLGSLTEETGWSFGFGLTQGVQFGFLGMNITIDTDYFLTTHTAQPPPFNRGFQLGRLKLAGRFVYPFGDVYPFGEISAARISIISNPLVEDTGPRLQVHSLGGTAGIRLLHLAPLYFEMRVSWDYLLDFGDSSVFGLNLAVGLRSIL